MPAGLFGEVSSPGGLQTRPGGWQSLRCPLLSRMLPSRRRRGLTGRPLMETDCLLLFLHLAGITSVFRRVICCPITTCNPILSPLLSTEEMSSAAWSQSRPQDLVPAVGSQTTSAGNPALEDFLL